MFDNEKFLISTLSEIGHTGPNDRLYQMGTDGESDLCDLKECSRMDEHSSSLRYEDTYTAITVAAMNDKILEMQTDIPWEDDLEDDTNDDEQIAVTVYLTDALRRQLICRSGLLIENWTNYFKSTRFDFYIDVLERARVLGLEYGLFRDGNSAAFITELYAAQTSVDYFVRPDNTKEYDYKWAREMIERGLIRITTVPNAAYNNNDFVAEFRVQVDQIEAEQGEAEEPRNIGEIFGDDYV